MDKVTVIYKDEDRKPTIHEVHSFERSPTSLVLNKIDGSVTSIPLDEIKDMNVDKNVKSGDNTNEKLETINESSQEEEKNDVEE